MEELNIVVLFAMIFMHIVDDYYLQGCLAQFKQKIWWEKNAPDELYKYDYIVALIEHAFSWTFMIMIPVTIALAIQHKFNIQFYIFFFMLNWIIHGFTDNYKANKKKINLILDQTVHILQIIYTWINFMGLLLGLI